MFGFIKKLIAGILGFLASLLPGKKNGGYYLELKEDTIERKTAVAAPPNGTKTAAKVAEASPAPAKTAKVAVAKNSTNAEAPKAAPAPVATPTTPGETTFAPKYLAPLASASDGRRRPGANMNSFLDMASQVKTPS